MLLFAYKGRKYFQYFFFIFIIILTAEFLECWHCSSITVGAEAFCDEDFSEYDIPSDLLRDRNITVTRRCNSSINSEHERAVCRKTVEESNGRIVTKRFCYYTNKSDPLDHCMHETTEKNVKRIFCQDCLTHKCNGGLQLGVQFGVVSLPILLAKLFMI